MRGGSEYRASGEEARAETRVGWQVTSRPSSSSLVVYSCPEAMVGSAVMVPCLGWILPVAMATGSIH